MLLNYFNISLKSNDLKTLLYYSVMEEYMHKETDLPYIRVLAAHFYLQQQNFSLFYSRWRWLEWRLIQKMKKVKFCLTFTSG